MIPILPTKLYNVLKMLTLIVLPALGTFYYTVSQGLNFGGGEQVLLVDTATCTLLGTILGLSNAAYNRSDARFDGEYELNRGDDGQTTGTFMLNKPPVEAAVGQKALTYRVVDKT